MAEEVRPLTEADAEAFVALRRAALLDAPLAFASSPSDDRAASAEAFRRQLRAAPESVVLGAFDPGLAELVGMVGLRRDDHEKCAHKAHAWGMYVAPAHRGRGVAARLLDAAVAHARAMAGVEWIHLSVSEAAPEARRLYERAGFAAWGTEPDALRHGGRSVVEHYLALRLG